MGALGVGYAHWFETVDINQSVDTGKVCIGFSKQNTSEPFGEFEDKDVGSITCELVGDIKGYVDYAGVPTPVYAGIEVLMANAYPCYQTALFADVANCGTIPVKSDITYTMVRIDPDTGAVIEVLTVEEVSPGSYVFKNAAGIVVFSMDVVNLVGAQIHAGEKDVVEFDFHLKQEAEQGAIYILTIYITATQWNLYGMP
jgi:hypothetical protein